MTTHFHIFTWVVGIILFFAAYFMPADAKAQKIVHMIARLFYVLIVISGAMLFFGLSAADPAMYSVKFLLGLLTIGMAEMATVRKKKGKPSTMFLILFIVFLVVTIGLGFHLPAGW